MRLRWEAGLGFCVKLEKGDFIGREALVRQKAEGLAEKLVCLTLADPASVVIGGEPILGESGTIGRVTSGGYGYTVGAVDRLRLTSRSPRPHRERAWRSRCSATRWRPR
jgi:hypothetical protein